MKIDSLTGDLSKRRREMTMKKVKLSVCMIVKNEEDKLQECLDSVKEIADEIVVVDNGSTDRTVEILKRNECIIIDGSNFYVDEGRNLYLEKAQGDWIFIIDADERLDHGTAKILKEELAKLDDDVYGAQMKNIQYIGEGKWADVYALRIIRNRCGIKYNNTPIHSTLGPSITNQGKKIKPIRTILHHMDILYSGRTKFKREKYRTALIKQLDDKFKATDIDTYFLDKAFLGLEYAAIQEYDVAADIFQACIDSSTKFKSFAKAFLAQMYIVMGKFGELKNIIENADKNDMDLFKSTEVYGNYLFHYDIEKCIHYYESACEMNEFKVSNLINLAYLLKRTNPEKSCELMRKAIHLNEYLTEDIVFKEGERPNLFHQQSNFLSGITNVKNLLSELGVFDEN